MMLYIPRMFADFGWKCLVIFLYVCIRHFDIFCRKMCHVMHIFTTFQSHSTIMAIEASFVDQYEILKYCLVIILIVVTLWWKKEKRKVHCFVIFHFVHIKYIMCTLIWEVASEKQKNSDIKKLHVWSCCSTLLKKEILHDTYSCVLYFLIFLLWIMNMMMMIMFDAYNMCIHI